MSNEIILSGCEDRLRFAGYSAVFTLGTLCGMEVGYAACQSLERFSISKYFTTVEGVFLFGAGIIIFRNIGKRITSHSNGVKRQWYELKDANAGKKQVESIRAMDRYFYTVKLVDFNIRLIGAFLVGLGSGLIIPSTA